MNQLLRNRRTALAVVAVVLGVAGWWGVERWQRSDVAPVAATAAPDLLAAIPPPTGNAETDMAIGRAIASARDGGDDADRWVALGDALMQKVRETADPAYYGYAERAFEQAVTLNPGSVGGNNGLAWVYSGQHQFARSIEWANKAVALDPQNNLAYGLLGDADVELGDYAAAYEHYQKMLDLRPDLSSYSRSAHLLQVTGQTFRAAWLMRQAIAAGAPAAENTAWCRAQLALIYFGDGNYAAAESVLDDALRRTPDDRHVLAAMGKVKAALHDYAAAIGFYGKAVAITPEHDALVALGDLHAVTGDSTAAEALYARVEELHRRNHVASDTTHDFPMAQFYVDHDRNLVEALRLAEERKTTRNVFEIDVLAWSYFKNGQLEEAKTAIQRALTRRTPDARFLYHAGMIHAKLDDRVTAQKYLYQALSMNPAFDPIGAVVATRTLHELGESVASFDPREVPAAAAANDASPGPH